MTINASPEWKEYLAGEMLLLGLLGRAWQLYPAAEERLWFQTLIDEEVFSEAPFAASQPDVEQGLRLLQEWSHASLSEDTFDALQGDHIRLFIGPAKVLVAPWESVYFNKERLTFQEQTLEVRGWYRRFGLQSQNL